MHVIAAKGQCFKEAMSDEFKNYQNQVLKNIKSLAKVLQDNGFRIVSNGTDNHLILVDVTSVGLTGKEAEEMLDNINITVNKNTIPYDKLKPNISSGIRIGSPAMTTRHLDEKDFELIGKIIVRCLKDKENQQQLKNEVSKITSKYPIYEEVVYE